MRLGPGIAVVKIDFLLCVLGQVSACDLSGRMPAVERIGIHVAVSHRQRSELQGSSYSSCKYLVSALFGLLCDHRTRAAGM